MINIQKRERKIGLFVLKFGLHAIQLCGTINAVRLLLTFNVTLSFHLRTIESARKSFHVTKLWNVSPVIRSQVMNVLRCVDIPKHDISDAVNFASVIAFLTVVTIDCHKSSGLISTNPGCGYNNSIYIWHNRKSFENENENLFIRLELQFLWNNIKCKQIVCALFYIWTCSPNNMYVDIIDEASKTGGADIQRCNILLTMTIRIHFLYNLLQTFVFLFIAPLSMQYNRQ